VRSRGSEWWLNDGWRMDPQSQSQSQSQPQERERKRASERLRSQRITLGPMHRFYASHARVAAGDAWTNKAATCFCRCPPRVTACHSPQPEAAAHQAAVGWLKALSILYPLLCTLYSVLCTLLSILCLLPSAFCSLPSTLCFCLALPCLEPARPAAQMRSRGHCRSIGAAASRTPKLQAPTSRSAPHVQ
jgi:hypothetical protein